jgi:hypothetical protein
MFHRVITGRPRERTGAFRALALWLGLFALMIQAMAPLCLSGQTSASGNSIIICTAHGFETVTLDADGKPTKNAPDSAHHNSDCALCGACHIGGGFTTPPAVALFAPSVFGIATQTVAYAPALTQRSHVFYVGRAPPETPQAHFA